MKIRMWEAVAAPGRLAELEAAAALLRGGPGETVEASTDGISRVVVTVHAQGEPSAVESRLAPDLFERAHAWTFTRL